MNTATYSAEYTALQDEVKQQLADFYEMGKIKLEELMAVLYIFSFTETAQELQAFLVIFADSFPVLKEVQIKQKAADKITMEHSVVDVVKKVLPKNPALAAKLSKEASKSGMTMEKILEIYPEVKDYL
jgi:inorganic pyrophosphatase/exopolyphosphatase